jgi:legumain
LISLLAVSQAVEWAVIVAGSNTYANYRHQSDVCHAYQIAHANGIPDSRIIMMYYDDIANNVQNPYRGQIFNKPTATGTPGVDVYGGCKKDYVGLNVTAAMFVAVITGDTVTTKGGPVLMSGPSDHVFINFVDHGGTGIIAFPTGPYLTSVELNAALQTMVTKKMFGQLTFYMEACEAGSMFQGQLPTNQQIYVTTAANAVESSWGTYCPPDDFVNGKEINSCLGDLYSVNWMEDTDISGHINETLEVQYTTVMTETTLSHVMQYGDLSFTTADKVGDFLGDTAPATKEENSMDHAPRARSSVRSRDIPMHLAYYKYLRSAEQPLETRMEYAKELMQELEYRINADDFFMALAKKLGDSDFFYLKSAVPCTTCCGTVYQAYVDRCGTFTDYSIQYTRVLGNACKAGVSIDAIVATLDEMC